MIILLGSTGYVGNQFVESLNRAGLEFETMTRQDIHGKTSAEVGQLLVAKKASFLINAAGYTGKPNVDACEVHKQECLFGNAVLPGILSEAASAANIPWGHVSSGCIYNGSTEDGEGFAEDDPPNFSFRSGPCSFYSGTKALGEEIISTDRNCYVWRLRIPFNQIENPRNYLAKLLRYERLLEARNSISHLQDYVESCIQCIQKDVPYGVYNLTNPGSITTREVVQMMTEAGLTDKAFSFFDDEAEFMSKAAKTPRSNCVMNTAKSVAAGIGMRPVREELEDSIKSWTKETD